MAKTQIVQPPTMAELQDMMTRVETHPAQADALRQLITELDGPQIWEQIEAELGVTL